MGTIGTRNIGTIRTTRTMGQEPGEIEVINDKDQELRKIAATDSDMPQEVGLRLSGDNVEFTFGVLTISQSSFKHFI